MAYSGSKSGFKEASLALGPYNLKYNVIAPISNQISKMIKITILIDSIMFVLIIVMTVLATMIVYYLMNTDV